MKNDADKPKPIQDDKALWWIDWSRRHAYQFYAMTADDIRGNPDNLSPEQVEFMMFRYMAVQRRLKWEADNPDGPEFPGAFLHEPPEGCSYPKPPPRRSGAAQVATPKETAATAPAPAAKPPFAGLAEPIADVREPFRKDDEPPRPDGDWWKSPIKRG